MRLPRFICGLLLACLFTLAASAQSWNTNTLTNITVAGLSFTSGTVTNISISGTTWNTNALSLDNTNIISFVFTAGNGTSASGTYRWGGGRYTNTSGANHILTNKSSRWELNAAGNVFYTNVSGSPANSNWFPASMANTSDRPTVAFAASALSLGNTWSNSTITNIAITNQAFASGTLTNIAVTNGGFIPATLTNIVKTNY